VVTPQKVLDWYEQGRMVAGEAVCRLCDLATRYEPATFAESVPTEWLADIRDRTTNIPTPEQVRIVFGGTCVGGAEAYKAWEKAEKERYVAGLRTWKAYFESVERVIRPPENSHDPDS
jgi:hypothetical protein